MMPASAASTGPRSEVSSQGCAITVRAGGTTSLALAMSRSYLERGGCPNGLRGRTDIGFSLRLQWWFRAFRYEALGTSCFLAVWIGATFAAVAGASSTS